MAVIAGAPVAFVIAVAAFVLIAWLIFRFLHQRELTTIPNLQTELSIRDAEIARLKDSITKKDKELTKLESKLKEQPVPVCLSQSIFHIEKQHWNLWWQAKGVTGWQTVRQFTPEEPIPNDAGLVLEVQATINATPPRLLQDLQLEIMGQRLPEEKWVSRMVDQNFFYLNFPIPSSLPLGTHQARLVAVLSHNDTETIEQKFSPFEVCIARTYADLRR